MSRKDFPIATAFEKTAKELSPEECFFGFLCWYCDANLIENGAKQAFIGINPAGKPNDADHDQEKGYPEKPYTDPGWNAFWIRSGTIGTPIKTASQDFLRQCTEWGNPRELSAVLHALMCVPFV